MSIIETRVAPGADSSPSAGSAFPRAIGMCGCGSGSPVMIDRHSDRFCTYSDCCCHALNEDNLRQYSVKWGAAVKFATRYFEMTPNVKSSENPCGKAASDVLKNRTRMGVFAAMTGSDPYGVRIGGIIADPYRICLAYGLDPVISQAVKKLLRSGRKHKDTATDVREAITTLERWEAIRAEDQNDDSRSATHRAGGGVNV